MNISGTVTGFIRNGQVYCRAHADQGVPIFQHDAPRACAVCGCAVSNGDRAVVAHPPAQDSKPWQGGPVSYNTGLARL